MAMLAERKRKEKWCSNPRGKSWSDDTNKFGQQLLEKMGWSPGQGLGANNQGPTECVKVKKKDDSKGLGFKDNGEEWLKTTSEFNDLLGELHSKEDDKNEGGQSEVPLSLEDRSKNSKARVHYHKFTRGKDLSRYSEKDLASIIGPDALKQKNGDECSGNYTSNQVVKGSSTEYFNSKKQTGKNNSLQDASCEDVNSVDYVDSSNDNNKKKKRKNKSAGESEKQDEQSNCEVEGSSKKKKKHKNRESYCENTVVSEVRIESDINTAEIDSSQEISTRKKNKRNQAGDVENIQTEEITEKKISKKRKKVGEDLTLETGVQDKSSEDITENTEDDLNISKKKKKKKEDKEYTLETDIQEKSYEVTTENIDDLNTSKKKKKKKEDKEYTLETDIQDKSYEVTTENIDDLNTSKKKKKKKVDKEYTLETDVQNKSSVDTTENKEDDLNTSSSKKNKKKKVDKDYNLETDVQDKSSVETTEIIEDDLNTSKKKKKKKKVADESVLSIGALEDSYGAIPSDSEEKSVKLPKSERRVKKVKLLEEDLNESTLHTDISEEQPSKSKKKSKKEKLSENVNSMETGDAEDTTEQENHNDCEEYIEVRGRQTRLRKVFAKTETKSDRYETEEFIAFDTHSSQSKTNEWLSVKTEKNDPQLTDTDGEKLNKVVHIDPNDFDLDIDRTLVNNELNLVLKRLYRLKIAFPKFAEMRNTIYEIKNRQNLDEALCGKLRVMQMVKELKPLLPQTEVSEIESIIESKKAIKPKRLKTIKTEEHDSQQTSNSEEETGKVIYLDPKEFDINTPRHIATFELKLLKAVFKQLNIAYPTFYETYNFKLKPNCNRFCALKAMQISKQLKLLLPRTVVSEVEGIVNSRKLNILENSKGPLLGADGPTTRSRHAASQNLEMDQNCKKEEITKEISKIKTENLAKDIENLAKDIESKTKLCLNEDDQKTPPRTKKLTVFEYRMVMNKLKELKIEVPNIKVVPVLEGKEVSGKNVKRMLKEQERIRQLKLLLPENDRLELEESIKEHLTSHLRAVDFMKKIIEMEESIALLAQDAVKNCRNLRRNSSFEKKEVKSLVLDGKQEETLRNMSEQVQLFLKDHHTIFLYDPDECTDNNNMENEAGNTTPDKGLEEKNDINHKTKEEQEASENERKISLKYRTKAKLKTLSKQINLLLEGKVPEEFSLPNCGHDNLESFEELEEDQDNQTRFSRGRETESFDEPEGYQGNQISFSRGRGFERRVGYTGGFERGRGHSGGGYESGRDYNSGFERGRGYSRGFERGRGYSRGFESGRGYTSRFERGRGYSRGFESGRGYTSGFERGRGYSRGCESGRGYTRGFERGRGHSRGFDRGSGYNRGFETGQHGIGRQARRRRSAAYYDQEGYEEKAQVQNCVPSGGWGALQHFTVREGYQSTPSWTRERGRFRGRGRSSWDKPRGRISQNNFDAKVYAEKCKSENKVPEISFKGVDLKSIFGYAAGKDGEGTNPSSPQTPKSSLEFAKKLTEIAQVIVEKEKSCETTTS